MEIKITSSIYDICSIKGCRFDIIGKQPHGKEDCRLGSFELRPHGWCLWNGNDDCTTYPQDSIKKLIADIPKRISALFMKHFGTYIPEDTINIIINKTEKDRMESLKTFDLSIPNRNILP